MSGGALRVGFCVPPFSMPGAAFFRTPGWTDLDGRVAVDAAVEAERLGYDALWMADHIMHGHDGAILEGWTALSVIAGRTTRARLGTIHLAQAFRHPGLIAKMVATLDHLSGGRVSLFYDWGFVDRELDAYGMERPAPEEIAVRVDDGVGLIRALWESEGPVDYRGPRFTTRGAICRPAPVQKPMPIWLGEARDDAWCDVVARRADGWNTAPVSPARLQEKLSRVHAACGRVGRDRASLPISLEIQILVAPTEREVGDRLRAIAALADPTGRPAHPGASAWLARGTGSPADTIDEWLIGTPARVSEQIATYRALGVEELMLWFIDFPSREGMRLFAREILPEVRR